MFFLFVFSQSMVTVLVLASSSPTVFGFRDLPSGYSYNRAEFHHAASFALLVTPSHLVRCVFCLLTVHVVVLIQIAPPLGLVFFRIHPREK